MREPPRQAREFQPRKCSGAAAHALPMQLCDWTLIAVIAGLAAIAPAVALRTPDGSGELLWTPEVESVVSILADTHSVPPAFAVRRESWSALAGFDECLEGLVEYAFWLKLASGGFTVRTISHPLIACELDDRSGADAEDGERRLRSFGAVLDRCADLLDRELVPLLVSGEVRFGRLREIHRELLTERDRDLANSIASAQRAAHHRAYTRAPWSRRLTGVAAAHGSRQPGLGLRRGRR
jgi:hypothetical protein